MWDRFIYDPPTYTLSDKTTYQPSIQEAQDYEIFCLFFASLFYGLLNFKAPAVDSAVAS